MPSNLDFDPHLLQEAQKISGLKYKKDVINLVLNEYIKRHKQLSILKFVGKVPYYDDYDPKQGRKKR